jgi:hypothetical protein
MYGLYDVVCIFYVVWWCWLYWCITLIIIIVIKLRENTY